MQKRWQLILSLTAVAMLGWANGCAMAQSDFVAPDYPQYVQYPETAPPVVPVGQMALTPGQIDQLLAPIALYPDPLLALIFPAATYPQDVQAAEQWLMTTPNPSEDAIDAQSWDPSIKALVHYPTVLKMMSDQIDLTQALGAAYLNQPQDVMASVQRLRAEAQAAGNLQSTPQEQVVTDGSAMRIEPVDPDVIYVPQYDPDVIYLNTSPIVFGVGLPIGLWCDNDFDWGQGCVVVGGGWYRRWHHPADWDTHPPAWDRHPAGWAPTFKTWTRVASKPPPRVTNTIITHLNLNHKLPPVPVGKPPAPEPSKNAFEPGNRVDVQRDVQRARPAPPAARPISPPPARIEPPLQRAAPPPPPRPAAPPPPPRSAPNNIFNGGSGGDARAQSDRGNASIRRR